MILAATPAEAAVIFLAVVVFFGVVIGATFWLVDPNRRNKKP